MDRVHDALRTVRYSPRTRSVYARWIRRFLIQSRAAKDTVGAAHVEAFLGKLAATEVAPATHNQALAALLFLFRRAVRVATLKAGICKRVSRLPSQLRHPPPRGRIRQELLGQATSAPP